MDGHDECKHGVDKTWCSLCNQAPPAPRRQTTKTVPIERRELAAQDYGLPPGTPFIDTFKGPHSFLSNFSRSAVEFDGVTYPTVEHAFQAAKTDVAAEREKLLSLGNPQWARREGKKVTLRPGWDNIRIDVMRGFLRQKFHHPELAAKLEATGTARLYEGNWWGDTFWGTVDGHGDNHLGELLMEIRDELRRDRAVE